MWVVGCEDDAQHVVDVGGVIGSAEANFFGGDDVHDVVPCHEAGKVGGEWAGFWHVLFPAGAEGKEDEEAEVAEGVGVLVFFLAEEGAGANSFD
jgi:hypothetical protein